MPVTDRDTEQDRVDAHVERCLRQLGFSACQSHVLNGAGADHYAEHLVRDLGCSVDQTYELLRPCPTRPPLQPASLRSDDMLRVEGDFR